MPDSKGMKPRYAEKSFANAAPNGLYLVASKTGHDGSMEIHQDADLWLAKLETGNRVVHTLAPGRHAFIHVAEGEVTFNGKALTGGDAALASDEPKPEISAAKPSQVLIFDLD